MNSIELISKNIRLTKSFYQFPLKNEIFYRSTKKQFINF